MSTNTNGELTYHDEDSVDGPDDVHFPGFAHHLQVRSELTEMCRRGMLDGEEADEVYDQWLDSRNN